jgi:hypothetical protein
VWIGRHVAGSHLRSTYGPDGSTANTSNYKREEEEKKMVEQSLIVDERMKSDLAKAYAIVMRIKVPDEAQPQAEEVVETPSVVEAPIIDEPTEYLQLSLFEDIVPSTSRSPKASNRGKRRNGG